MMKNLLKYLYLFWFGGTTYVTLEIFYRGYSHWTMFLLAGFVFIIIGLINNCIDWDMDIGKQILIGTMIATVGEFLTGCIVNLWLGWNVWDYSDMWGNVLGQICPVFILIWIPVVLVAIVMDDVLRYVVFNEELPRYYIFNKEVKLKWLKEWKY